MTTKKPKVRPLRPTKESDISTWLKRETSRVRKALETASRHFDKNDDLDVHTLESIYAQESSFGQNRGKRNSKGAAGDFQLEPGTAREMGLIVSKSNDQRFNIDDASSAAAKLLKKYDNHFRKSTTLFNNVQTIPIPNAEERKKFTLAAYNGGDSLIAKAQKAALEAGKDPTKWEDVQKYLSKAGARENKAKEIRNYVKHLSSFEKDFDKKSKADANAKYKKGKPVDPYPRGGHWVTIDGRHIFIEE